MLLVRWKFTFQYGEIKRQIKKLEKYIHDLFTFQYGEIKSIAAGGHTFYKLAFTFQYGEIKSTCYNVPSGRLTYLHSSMERLKVVQIVDDIPKTSIYIPVWRD